MKLNGDRCRCRGCGEYFNSTAAFDRHRTGDGTGRRCLNADEMRAKGMAKRDSGFWVGSENLTRGFGKRKPADFSTTPVGW